VTGLTNDLATLTTNVAARQVAGNYATNTPAGIAAAGGLTNPVVVNAGANITITTNSADNYTIAGSAGGYDDSWTNSLGGLAWLDDIPMSSVTNAGDFATLDNIPSALVTNLNDSYMVPVALTSAPTVTITRANGSLVSLTVTNATCAIAMNATDWAAAGVGRVSLELFAGTNTVTWDTNTINWETVYAGSTVTNVSVQLRRGLNTVKWAGRQ
jgi:hypothetical protein